MGMDGEWLSGLENFGAVWRRVRGESAPAPKPEDGAAALLRGHMDAIAASAGFLTALAACGGAARETLLRLAAGEKRRFRCLQLEYFLLTGACHAPAESCPCRVGAAQGMRAAYLAARETEAALRADAERCGDELRAALLDAAEGESQNACALRNLLKLRMVDNIR